MTPAAVAPLVRAVAADAQAISSMPELVGCWVNRGWSAGLSYQHDKGWADEDSRHNGTGGLVAVLIARKHGWDKLAVSGYLVDVYCLGVKNALGPDIQNEIEFRRFRDDYFSAYQQGWQDAPIELAQHLVFGAVEYARALGLEPHEDFAAASEHLGAWSGPSAITFGNEGKPFYISGPYDDPRQVQKTLDRTAGEGNYHFVLGAPEFDVLDHIV